MPIYEYRCDQGHTFEVMQSISDDPVAACQTCDAPVHRVFHPVAVHFKGSGFYATDYGSRKRAKEQKETAESNGKKDGESSSKSGSDSGSDSGSSSGAKSDSKTSSSATKSD